MAKRSRKPSKAQRDKDAIAVAKKLKEKGILSKQTKLHGGHYISKEVLRKVRDIQYQSLAVMNYQAIKVSKELAQKAKERGYMVVQGNRVVGPTNGQFKKRLSENITTGIKPVRGGFMEEVTLPHSIFDLRSFIASGGDLNDLKMPDELFAFKYHGWESWRTFPNAQMMIDTLMHYQSIDTALNSNRPEDLAKQFDAITIFRLHPDTTPLNIPGNRARQERRKQMGFGQKKWRKTKYRPVDTLSDVAHYRRTEKERKKKAAQRARMSDAKLAEIREKNNERMRAKREAERLAKKGKKGKRK